MTVKEISRLTGVSVRTLQYYDKIGLLPPAAYSAAGYRLYDDASLERLSQILLWRELRFPLSVIRDMLTASDYDRQRALETQIGMLEAEQERLSQVLAFARNLYQREAQNMDFSAFDRSKLDDYAKRAREQWGHTPQYQESAEKEQQRTPAQQEAVIRDFMQLFAEFGEMRTLAPDSEPVQQQVRRLQDFITAHYYTCTDEILSGLGQMYAAGGEFTENIDRAGGEGTAAFTAQAIAVYCGKV